MRIVRQMKWLKGEARSLGAERNYFPARWPCALRLGGAVYLSHTDYFPAASNGHVDISSSFP